MILSKKKTRSALAEFCAIAKAIKAVSFHVPTSEAGLFHQPRIPSVKSPTSPWSMEKPLAAAP
jgi:hypothetical protein